MSLPFRPDLPPHQGTGTPVGRVLARIELVCCEILAGDVPPRGAADWVRRLIVKKPCGTPLPLTEHARELALALNICDRDEAHASAARLLQHCAHIRSHGASGEKPPAGRGFRLRTSRSH